MIGLAVMDPGALQILSVGAGAGVMGVFVGLVLASQRGERAREEWMRTREGAGGETVESAIRELHALHNDGILSRSEYDAEKRRLLDRLGPIEQAREH